MSEITTPITWQSTPLYDTWGWADYWNCDQWIQWHIALKDHYGKLQADSIWTEAWNKQDGFASPLNWCKYEGVFNSYVRQENLNATWWLPNILNNVLSGAENTSQAATNATKVLKWIVPGIVIIAALGLLYWSAKKFNLIK